MDFTVKQENGRVPVTLIQVAGNTDSASAHEFESKVMEVIETGARHLVLDLSKVPYMSSAGLRVLQNAFDKLRSYSTGESSEESNKEMYRKINEGSYKSPYMVLLNPTKEVEDVLKMTGFDMLVSIVRDLKTAIDAF